MLLCIEKGGFDEKTRQKGRILLSGFLALI